MNRLITYFSIGSAAFALAYGFERDLTISAIVCAVCVLVAIVGFRVEAFVKASGNDMLNRVLYFFSKDEKKYNVNHKRVTYNYLGNDRYSFEKKYEILPKIADLDRLNDRFSWSVPAVGYTIKVEPPHTAKQIWQQDMWTCYSVCFNETPEKNKPYKVISEVVDLVDTTRSAAPYMSNTIDKKTKCTTMVVTFPTNDHPTTAKFQVFSAKSGMDPNREETLMYDAGVGGFKKTVNYPRRGWRYVISWEK